MMIKIFNQILAPSLLLLLAAQQAQGGARTPPNRADPLDLRVVSFNIRYAAPASGNEKPWDVRGPHVIDQLAATAANATEAGAVPIIGLQEVLHQQLVDVESGLSPSSADWAHIGTGRDDGAEAGEYCPILYQSTVLNLLHSTQKWLSPTPDEPSFWPGAGSRRYVVVGVFEHAATGARFLAANTHLDNVSREARVGGIGIALGVIRAVQDAWGPLAVALTGDLNSEPDIGEDGEEEEQEGEEGEEDAYGALRADGYLRDLWALAGEGKRRGPYGTVPGFGPETVPRRIDFIHVGPDPEVTSEVRGYEVLDSFVDGVYISDHRAVVGDITIKL